MMTDAMPTMAHAMAPQRYNVLHLISDDLRPELLDAYGHNAHRHPDSRCWMSGVRCTAGTRLTGCGLRACAPGPLRAGAWGEPLREELGTTTYGS